MLPQLHVTTGCASIGSAAGVTAICSCFCSVKYRSVKYRSWRVVGQVFGGKVVRAPCGVMHGKTSLVYHDGTGLLQVLGPFVSERHVKPVGTMSAAACVGKARDACESVLVPKRRPSAMLHSIDVLVIPLQGLENPFQAARYHSLVIDQEGFPEGELEVRNWSWKKFCKNRCSS